MATKELSIEEKLEALYELQSIHSKMDQIHKLRGELPLEVRDLEDEISGIGVRVSKTQNEIEEFQNKINDLRNTAKDAETGLKKYEKQLNSVKNNREFDALGKEIENLKLDIALAEKRAKDFNEEIKLKNNYLVELGNQIDIKQTELKNKQSELTVIMEETSEEEKNLEKDSQKVIMSLDDRLINAYNRLRLNYRNKMAVVNIERDSCGGCFAKIPLQRQSEIRAKKNIIICEHCGRILVYKEIIREESEEDLVPKKKARTSRKRA